MIVTTADQLRQLVEEYSQHDSFCFDLETVYIPTAEDVSRYSEILNVPTAERSREDKAWLKIYELRPTDPMVNEVIWIGLSTHGRSDSIPTGHPKGTLLKPARKEKLPASEAYTDLEDKRRFTRTGKVSHRMVEIWFPAEFSPAPPQLELDDVLDALEPLFFSDRRKVNHNLKFDIKTLTKYYGRIMPGPYGDTAVAQAIVDERDFIRYNLESFVERHLGHAYDKLGKKGVHNFSFEEAARYAEQDAKFTWLIWRKLERSLKREESLWNLHEIEQELYGVLMDMELHGVMLDRERMEELRLAYEKRAQFAVDQLIVDYGARSDFNPNATVHKRELLFKQYKAPVVKFTDTKQPSTDAESLKMLCSGKVKITEGKGKNLKVTEVDVPTGASDVAQLLLDYAEVEKLIGTYLVGMGARLDADSYLHPDFVQYSVDTGRLSAREPNVQNIPKESDMRDLFIAPPGMAMVSCDYDQIELRFISYYAHDAQMRDVFLSGEDVHGATAAAVLGKKPSEVTPKERQNYGKMPNFLIGYGGGYTLLAKKTGITDEEAKAVIDAYFARFTKIEPWKERVCRDARARAVWGDVDGERKLVVPPWVPTMLGRRRRLPDLLINPRNARNKEEWGKMNGLKMRAERQASNTVTQGAAGETCKLAMIDIHNHVKREGFPLQMVLNVHDEIVALVDERHAEEGKELMAHYMSNVINPVTGLKPMEDWLPLVASGNISDRWMKA